MFGMRARGEMSAGMMMNLYKVKATRASPAARGMMGTVMVELECEDAGQVENNALLKSKVTQSIGRRCIEELRTLGNRMDQGSPCGSDADVKREG